MSDALKRAVRTYLQAAIGIFLGLWALSGIAPDDFQGISDLTVLGKLAAGSLIGAIPALLAFIQNALEDAGAVKPLLKPERGMEGNALADQGNVDVGYAAVLFVVGVLAFVVGGLILRHI